MSAAPSIRGFSHILPDRIVSNADLAPLLGVDPAWIEQVSGIRERRWAAAEDTVSSLATRAARACLERTAAPASDLALVLVASGSPERHTPGPAASVAAGLGLTTCPALDIPVASAGSLVALDLARRLAPSTGPILVVAAEIMSRRIDLTPEGKNTAILFGDGAAACLVTPEGSGIQLLDGVLYTDGTACEILSVSNERLHMEGNSVILQASRKLPRAITSLLEKHSIVPDSVAQVLLHQANLNLIQGVARATKVPADRFFTNIPRYGNTSAASLLIAASEWSASTITPPAGPIVFAAFGTGLTWGALLAQSSV